MNDPGERDPYAPPPAGWSDPPRQEPPPAPQPGSALPPGPIEPGGGRALALGVASLGTAVLFFPLALVLGPAAVILGVRAQRRAQRKRGRAPGAVGGIVCGVIGAILATGAAALVLLLYDEFNDYADCRSGANTEIAKQACEDQLRARLEDRFGVSQSGGESAR